MDQDLVSRFGVALAIGLLVGLQREWVKEEKKHIPERPPNAVFGGVRTYTLIGLAGAIAAHLSMVFDSAFVFVAALVVVSGFLALGYMADIRAGHAGLTSETAAVIVFLAGGIAIADEIALAAAVGVATTAVLVAKSELHRFAHLLEREDMTATVKFAVVAVLVLPVLPTGTYGPSPFDATSPFKVGLMVVFISAISFVGYVAIQLVGADRGVAVTGVLGGLVSSTAVTMALSNHSKQAHRLVRPLGLGLFLAWTIMFIRVLLEIAVVNLELLSSAWLPITAGATAGVVTAGLLYLGGRESRRQTDPSEFSNPFSLLPAIQFGLLYGAVLVVSKLATEQLGDIGVYASAIASGIADVDAITLSMAELSIGDGPIEDSTAARAIGLAAVSNTVVKGGIVAVIGSSALRNLVIPAMAVMVAATLAALPFV